MKYFLTNLVFFFLKMNQKFKIRKKISKKSKKFEKIINQELPVSNSESNGQEIPISDDDDEDYDEELMINASKNAETQPKVSEQEHVNLADTDTEYVDMTLSD